MRWAVRGWAGVWPVVRQSGERRHTGRVWRSRVQHVWYSTSQIPGTIWCRSTCSRCKCGGQGNICRIGGVGVTVRGGTEVTAGEPRGSPAGLLGLCIVVACPSPTSYLGFANRLRCRRNGR